MKFKRYTAGVLPRDLPEQRLCRGDVLKLEEHLPQPQRGDGE
ncbi:MAG: hypothetical protein ABSC03_16755 [Verrucomicrobiota bacterium]